VTPAARAQSRAVEVEVLAMTKRFGAFTALDDVSLRVEAGSFTALLGENGAGKSTLVKCLAGYHQPDAGQITVAGRERDIRSPHDAHALGIGMVYQHFTLVPSMTVAENLVMARDEVPAVVNWQAERDRLSVFMATVPFRLELDRPIARLAAGEKQKVEILKQLYLRRRFMILDEPTSVLTPAEADEVLGMLRAMTQAGDVTVLMITHKLREVMAFADEVAVLRRGKLVGKGRTAELTPAVMAQLMVGTREIPQSHARRTARPRRGSSSATSGSRTTPGVPPSTGSVSRSTAARSLASRVSRATASASWSRRSSGSAHRPAARSASAASPSTPRAPRSAAIASSAFPRNRCATPASPA